MERNALNPCFRQLQSSPCPTIGALNEADWYRRPSATCDVDGGVTKALDLSMEEVDTRVVCGMTCAKLDIATIMTVSMWYGTVLLSGMTVQVRTFHLFIDYPI